MSNLRKKLKTAVQLLSGHPITVGIETYTECNRKCWYCPVAHFDRKKESMSMDTFRMIFETLKSNHYGGDVMLCGYSEPLIDPQFFPMLEVARQIMPNNRLLAASNGDHFTPELLDKLASLLDYLLVTRHSRHDFKWHEYKIGTMTVVEQPAIGSPGAMINKVSSRAGLLRVGKLSYKPINHCMRQYALGITPRGDLGFCCEDYDAKRGLGINVHTSKDFFREWGAFPRAWKRLKILFGVKSKECEGCGESYIPQPMPQGWHWTMM